MTHSWYILNTCCWSAGEADPLLASPEILPWCNVCYWILYYNIDNLFLGLQDTILPSMEKLTNLAKELCVI